MGMGWILVCYVASVNVSWHAGAGAGAGASVGSWVWVSVWVWGGSLSAMLLV